MAAETGTDQTTPEVDVVICTRNRDASIAAAVASVMANDHPSFRLTIIDQSTTDATERAVAPLAAADPRIRYRHTTEAGLSRAYNTGIRSTTAEILAFTDDDCLVPTDWLSTIVAAFEAEPDGDLLYGQVLPHDTVEQHLTPWLPISEPEKLSLSTGFRIFGMGANYAARRRLFTKIGYFDEVLGGGGALRSSQDFDLEYRATVEGRPVCSGVVTYVSVKPGAAESVEIPSDVRTAMEAELTGAG